LLVVIFVAALVRSGLALAIEVGEDNLLYHGVLDGGDVQELTHGLERVVVCAW